MERRRRTPFRLDTGVVAQGTLLVVLLALDFVDSLVVAGQPEGFNQVADCPLRLDDVVGVVAHLRLRHAPYEWVDPPERFGGALFGRRLVIGRLETT